MLTATVIRPVWATKRVDGFPAGALLEVECEGSGHRIVALDQLGSGPGDRVLVTVGSAVTHHLSGNPPTDALVVGVLDEPATPGVSHRRSGDSTRKAQQ